MKQPLDLVSEFFALFSENDRKLREERGLTPLTEAELQHSALFFLRLLFRDRRPPWEVDELFATFGPKRPRQQQSLNRRSLAWQYGSAGKPPKLQFARRAAKLNATLKKEGYPKSWLLGSGTTNVENMHHYLKETLRQKEYRELADNICREKFSRKSPGTNIS